MVRLPHDKGKTTAIESQQVTLPDAQGSSIVKGIAMRIQGEGREWKKWWF